MASRKSIVNPWGMLASLHRAAKAGARASRRRKRVSRVNKRKQYTQRAVTTLHTPAPLSSLARAIRNWWWQR